MKNIDKLKSAEKCSLCKNSIEHMYIPMNEWKIKGALCGKCYSKKMSEYYPGEHTRVNLDKTD